MRIIPFLAAGGFLFFCSCSSTPGVDVTSKVAGSKVTLVSLDNLGSAGKPVGNPAHLDLKQVNGSAVRVDAEGKAPVYLVFQPPAKNKVSLTLKELPVCSAANEVNRNKPVRLVMKAYQALSEEDWNLARQLATKASELDATLAAPHIIQGLALFRSGNRAGARGAFNTAKALDPDDIDILELLRMVQ
jgi:hypothetical protein